MGIVADLLDLFPDTLIATPGAPDGFGAFVASGAVLSIPCYIEGQERFVRGTNGQEVASNLQVYVAGAYDLTVDNHRYTLPDRFTPETDLRAVGVLKVSDDAGEHHEIVMFP